jgi:uncharacterized protein YndB with AHSA1/START domain
MVDAVHITVVWSLSCGPGARNAEIKKACIPDTMEAQGQVYTDPNLQLACTDHPCRTPPIPTLISNWWSRFRYTPEQLFEGWTDPEVLKQWFCPRPWTVAECTIDLRPGGIFADVIQSPEGNRMPENTGCYLLIERPNRLIWTGILGEDFRPHRIPPDGFGFVCELRFTALEQGGSRYHVIVKHTDPEGKAKHEAMGFDQGWRRALSQLIELYPTR